MMEGGSNALESLHVGISTLGGVVILLGGFIFRDLYHRLVDQEKKSGEIEKELGELRGCINTILRRIPGE